MKMRLWVALVLVLSCYSYYCNAELLEEGTTTSTEIISSDGEITETQENAKKYFDRVKELLGGENTLEALKREAAIWHEMTVIEEMMPVYLEYGLK